MSSVHLPSLLERTKSITIDVPEDVDRRRMSMATERRRSTLGQIRPMSSGRLKSVMEGESHGET